MKYIDNASMVGYDAANKIEGVVGRNDIIIYLKEIFNVDILNDNNNYIGWMVGKIGDFQFKNGCITKR